MKNEVSRKQLARLLKAVLKNPNCNLEQDADKNRIILSTSNGKMKLPKSILRTAISDGLVTAGNGLLKITGSGISRLKRQMCDHDPFASQHRQTEKRIVKVNGIRQTVTQNCAESPLARLFSRKQKNGIKYISASEFEAGERIRRDFEKAKLQPSITSHWGAGSSAKKASRSTGQAHELSDVAIDAKDRFERAMNVVGPELTGITLDICCFLKGFESVERERGWPNRSAKLMLKTALSRLARHYGYCTPVVYRSHNRSGDIGSWEAPDYRPTL